MTSVLAFSGVHQRYGKCGVLSDVSFELPESSTTVLLGPNGAGKSTLIRMVLGLHKPTSGQVSVAGHDALHAPEQVRRLVGYVPDKPDVPAWMTPSELFKFLKPQYPNWSDERAWQLCADMHVPLRQKFSSLSRGQGTKAMLAAALAFGPRLVLLDEPFGPLDPTARDDVMRGVLGGLASEGCAVLIATHDLHMAARIADRVILLENGRVRADGPLNEVLGSDDEGSQVPARLKGLFERDSAERALLS